MATTYKEEAEPGENRSSSGKCCRIIRTANATVVREAWAAAGHGGSISQTLVNKQRSEMGLAGT